MKKIAIVLGALFAHKYATAATASALAAATATGTGADPWPWAIGAFGAVVVYVKRPPTTRADAIVNSIISVLIGGMVAPLTAAAVAKYLDPALASDYVNALILSSLWPWLLPMAIKSLKDRIHAL
jgi:hypothetical protein